MMNVVGNEDFFLLAMRISYWVCLLSRGFFLGCSFDFLDLLVAYLITVRGS